MSDEIDKGWRYVVDEGRGGIGMGRRESARSQTQWEYTGLWAGGKNTSLPLKSTGREQHWKDCTTASVII